ncbi:uncharacterized protein LOC129915415 [Episyrphus balteatus]|uniref:uncharacterized protein LOC129911727 n=1 Tax=Episyrphus balteatus TaxID=286459 RepID=UPI0024862789|nr:uncharacterized protein LOC129911727 [Episyrphus balteatus]XP_055845577.1 uncharacterized protein LOC129911727 [Episyrphus balteatus]XP_055850906.1 uncharacterized protein LOC129915415 [Episyrphus balteatus]
MPYKRSLNPNAERRRRQQAKKNLTSPQRQERLSNYRRNRQTRRYEENNTLLPSTSLQGEDIQQLSTSEPIQEQQPSTSEPIQEQQPSTSEPIQQQQPSTSEPIQQQQPSTSEPIQQQQPSTSAYHLSSERIREEINRRRSQDKLAVSYCCAWILHNDNEVQTVFVGYMNITCIHCSAKLFPLEVVSGSSNICCHKGKVTLPEVTVCDELRNLIEANNENTKNYLNNVRQYNNALAFASIQVNYVNLPGRGPFCFKIHGKIYHLAGSLQCSVGQTPSYAGLFIIDAEQALEQRLYHEANKDCNIDIMRTLQSMLERHNPYAQMFKFMKDSVEVSTDFQLTFSTVNAFDPRRYNTPRSNEIAAIFTSTDGAPPGKFDFVIYSKSSGSLTKISNLNPHCDPMCYPMLFPCGDSGWRPGIHHVNIHKTPVRNVTTQLQYYCYRLSVRGDFNLIHASGKLFQQYVVDSFVKVEGSRIAYIKSHQKELRAENYKGLIDFMNSDAHQTGALVGIPVVLPSTFLGSPRNMLQNFQDAMTIVTRFGKPDIFLTFTCNPNWVEIKSELKPYEKIENRPDLITRVFHLKLKLLLDDLFKGNVLGVVTAYVYVIEFQKRGLPHAHVLFMVRDEDKLRDKERIDAVVSSEIPDSQKNPRLFNIVMQCMVHGPCGVLNMNSPCMRDGQCSKGYPKSFANETNMNVNGYPIYRRRDNGRSVLVGSHEVDNRWIVPYNAFLTLKYQAHINVEICSSVRSVKYLYKYIYKGHDCASVRLRTDREGQQQLSLNEPDLFLNCRYVSPPEAMWRLHERSLFDRSHTIQRLPVHLPNEQMIYFGPGQELPVNLNRETKLTAFFKLCQYDETAREYFYQQIPEHYTWGNSMWKTRQRFSKAIGRIFTVSPNDRERYFLRLLLLHVKGPQSYENIRTVDGTLCETYQEAAEKLHLLENDREWTLCLQEAVNMQMPFQLRQLFAIICLFCSPSNVLQLWITFEQFLTEDFSKKYNAESSTNRALGELELIFRQHGRTLEQFGLPTPTQRVEQEAEDTYNIVEESAVGQLSYDKLNVEQREIVDEILIDLQSGKGHSYFIDGPGGTGKTFLYRTLCSILRGEGKVVLCVAWTGIAASLLEGGRTCHSLFKLPVPILETSVSSIRSYSKQADIIRQASLIIWDEISMVPKDALHVVDRLLREIFNKNDLFGGKTILFGGDFRQVLPVVRHGNRTSIVETNVKQSPLWSQIHKRKLKKNMRANEDQIFCKWLLQLGDGDLQFQTDVSPEAVKIPKSIYVNENEFVYKIFNTSIINQHNVMNFVDRAILCPKNDDCDKINNFIVNNIVEGEPKTYFSNDSLISEDQADEQLYTVEFLNSISHSGLPPHELVLKKNTTIMLIRNLNAREGLINGARMVITRLGEFTLTARLLNNQKTVLIPRISLTPSDATMPFSMIRKQFPVKISYAMTINKSQGQTLQRAGLYLPNPVFCHGQLYVAFSRVQSFSNICVWLKETEKQIVKDDCIITSNIVFKEVL